MCCPWRHAVPRRSKTLVRGFCSALLQDTGRKLGGRSKAMGKALLLNQRTFPCIDRHCDSLLETLARGKCFDSLSELPPDLSLTSLSFIPDVVFLRLTEAGGWQMIERCRARWG